MTPLPQLFGAIIRRPYRELRHACLWRHRPPTNGAREGARRLRQIATGQLRAENGAAISAAAERAA